MSFDVRVEEPPPNRQYVESVRQQLTVVEAQVRAARSKSRADTRKLVIYQAAIWYLLFVLKFRGLRSLYDLWPVGVAIVVPMLGTTVVWVICDAMGLSFVTMLLSLILGCLASGLICIHLLSFPSRPTLQLQLSTFRDREVAARHTSRLSAADFAAINSVCSRLREQFQRLSAELTQFEERQRQVALERQRQRELALQRYFRSKQYLCGQLFDRDWRSLRGIDFECFLKEVFEALGFEAELTKASGDQGVDLVVVGNDMRIAVQAKGYLNNVSNDAIQQAYAGMAYYRCNKCVVITNSRFTRSAEELAARIGCLLVDENAMRAFVMGEMKI